MTSIIIVFSTVDYSNQLKEDQLNGMDYLARVNQLKEDDDGKQMLQVSAVEYKQHLKETDN